MSKEKIIITIIRHLELCNEKPEDWYVSIMDDLETFFLEHQIDKAHRLWISRETNSVEDAKAVKNELVETFRMKPEVDKEQGNHVLCYKK